MEKQKRVFLQSVLSLVLCIFMLIGTTFAWFTDNVSSTGNVIKTGNLDIEMYWTTDLDSGDWYNVEDKAHNTIFNYDNWEPGYTEVRYIKIVNKGSLALNYELTLSPVGNVGKLAEVIQVYYANDGVSLESRADLSKLNSIGFLNNVMNGGATANGTLLAADEQSPLHESGETIITLAMSMITTAGNEYQNESIGDGFSITALATQCLYEADSFGNDYDGSAEFPSVLIEREVSAAVIPMDGKVPEGGVTIAGSGIKAVVPEGVLLNEGTDTLTVKVTPLEKTTSDITVVNQEVLIPVDVHIEGVSKDNTTPIVISLGAVMPKYLNMGNYTLVHVEEDGNQVMRCEADVAELDAHNEFTYEPTTGEVTVAMASFSEVAVIADTENAWKGTVANAFASGTGTENDPYIIANADQLAYMGDCVSNDNATYGSAYYKLIADVNIGGSGNSVVFYPIGYNKVGGEVATAALDEIYFEPISSAQPGDKDGDVVSAAADNSWYTYGGAFEGVFDGAGHKISGIYQNTWAMKGDYDGHYYNDAMGLFGYVNGGTVKNLTIDNFFSEGEFAPTGCVTAYAGGNATFENIAITNSHPQTYNTGVAGIVGWDNGNNSNFTFKNITVDDTNTISALWGSWDVAASGILGCLKNGSKAYFENCNVAATIDVYNDVCGNYQYYWYRYSGAFIGTVYKRLDNGQGALDLSDVTATNCTVNFGDRHEYYYCEFVENTKASYTHDYQMSRVDNKEIVGSGDSATCQNHNHEAHGYETVNGESVLVEDKQAVYIPYRQLFGGYGWGVDGVDLGEYDNIGITEVTTSEEKFVKAESASTTYMEGNTVSIGKLFEKGAIKNDKLDIVSDNVQVFVSPVGNTSTVSGSYKPDTVDWTKGTLTFSGVGKATISITDYYFCKTTTIEVTVTERVEAEQFEKNFNNEYLYRVGNQNAVTLESLFATINHIEVDDSKVDVTVEKENENSNASGVFTANATEWEKGTIQFKGTGVAKVTITIKEDTYCIPTELKLEVIDATNVTKYSELKNYNTTSVLLKDIEMSSGGAFYLNGGATLYGNGFTFDCTNAAYKGSSSVSENYVIGLQDAHLDNVTVVGKVYTTYGAQASNDYNRALVVSKGNSTITNCYLSNTASPIRLVEGSLEVEGTTVKGGNFANIDVRNGHLTVEDVTTINQANENDKAGNTTVVGLGIVVYYENVDPTLTSVNIKGSLKQYNHISSKDEFGHEYATQFVGAMMGTDYTEFQTKVGDVTWVNSGIVSMTGSIIPKDDRSDKSGYVGKAVKFYSKDGYIYTVKPTEGSIGGQSGNYETLGQGAIAPEYDFDYTTKNYMAKTDASNDYCYYDNGKVLIAMDQGDTFEWDPFILTATKNDVILDYTVSYAGKTYTAGQKISFNTSGEYVITYTYKDFENYKIDADGNLESVPKTYTKTVKISVSVIKPAAKHATFLFADTNTETKKVTVNDKTYISAKDVGATDKEWGYITINGTKIFYPITEAQMEKNPLGTEVQVYYYVFKDAVTIIDYEDGGTGNERKYDENTGTMPSNLAVVNGMEAKYTAISSACVDISKLTKDGPSGEVWDFSASTTVSGTTQYKKYLAHSSPSGLAIKKGTRDYDAITVAQFSYTDAAGATYYYFVGYFMPYQVGGGGCVTPDTLITLADGSQVCVDSLTGDEELLVWNMETGSLDFAPIMFVDSDPEATYEVIKLYFLDGTEVKVISEHGFWDYDLNKYVYLDRNAAQYIGHTFAKQNGDKLEKVTLVDVILENQVTTAWSPVTAGHLCYFVNGMLSMPGGVGGLFNIFDVVPETMTYDYVAMICDIMKYGLFTYEELSQYADLPEAMFEAAGGPYLKVSIGKGNMTMDELVKMINRYGKYFN